MTSTPACTSGNWHYYILWPNQAETFAFPQAHSVFRASCLNVLPGIFYYTELLPSLPLFLSPKTIRSWQIAVKSHLTLYSQYLACLNLCMSSFFTYSVSLLNEWCGVTKAIGRKWSSVLVLSLIRVSDFKKNPLEDTDLFQKNVHANIRSPFCVQFQECSGIPLKPILAPSFKKLNCSQCEHNLLTFGQSNRTYLWLYNPTFGNLSYWNKSAQDTGTKMLIILKEKKKRSPK